jgi:hypothetical protein
VKIAILGWGSLLWDKRPEFDEQHDEWQFDGPKLKIEFSRVSIRDLLRAICADNHRNIWHCEPA